jgi:hypothetical protein
MYSIIGKFVGRRFLKASRKSNMNSSKLKALHIEIK